MQILGICLVLVIRVHGQTPDSECMYERNGASYTGSENVTSNGTECLDWTDPRVVGYSMEQFPDGLIQHNFCRNPRRPGGQMALKPWCFVPTLTGITYAFCEGIKLCDCTVGLFGPGCTKICRCRDPKDHCSPGIGSCRSGCAAGWTGIGCQNKCQEGHYGLGCANRCLNCYKSRCDSETGVCTDGCDVGFHGDNCTERCSTGWYGPDCALSCGKCFKGEACHYRTGHCFAGCVGQYATPLCTEVCEVLGPYGGCGRRCNGNCSEGMTCDTSTGMCRSRASDSQSTTKAANNKIKVTAITGSVLVLLAVLVAITIVIIWRRRAGKTIRRREQELLQGYCLETSSRTYNAALGGNTGQKDADLSQRDGPTEPEKTLRLKDADWGYETIA